MPIGRLLCVSLSGGAGISNAIEPSKRSSRSLRKPRSIAASKGIEGCAQTERLPGAEKSGAAGLTREPAQGNAAIFGTRNDHGSTMCTMQEVGGLGAALLLPVRCWAPLRAAGASGDACPEAVSENAVLFTLSNWAYLRVTVDRETRLDLEHFSGFLSGFPSLSSCARARH